MRTSTRAPISAALIALSSLAAAQTAVPRTDDDATPVVVVTKIPLPWYVPRVVVARKFRDAIPEYEAVPGLAYKYFTIADDAKFGGIYLWSSRAQAKAWFNEAWHARVLAQRGAAAQVTMFDAPLVLDNGTPVGTDGDAVAAIVRIRIPTGVSRDTLIAEFNKSAPFYRSVSGLARKYFLITDDGQFGGVYLWKSRDAGQAFFDAAWRDRVLKTYGSPAQLDWFDAPVILPSKLPAAVP